ncbi:MAG: SDR family oxidoreductase [Oscillospiraceae bacterium]|jgi:NAD(P)-dependent dehydrogenase (short-subunit alcohol dehydrogenase family)|nr:SDR family oxidoreductase [Oscillospiraceae bacterium]
MTPEIREKAARIAPAVRMLLKTGETAIVTFREAEVSLGAASDGLCVLPSSLTLESAYKLLEERLAKWKIENGKNPGIVGVEGLGIFAFGINTQEASETAGAFLSGSPLPRRGNAPENAGKRLAEKIVVITGSAQGFGLGIAEEMLKQGANVVLADLNYDLACRNQEILENQYGKYRVTSVKVDVSDEESVRTMVEYVVLMYGGIDVFVSNAGVLKAGSLEEMTLSAFEFVTKINYTAFFLCAKYASEIMKIQHRFAPGYYSDIIQINSKSGLSGSNKNFAYAGGKFGGIGLVQSFALELVPYHIKVNAVCPGNLLSGPLWTDPEKGLFVQYLNTGKVPGAKTVEDVRRFYESKVPMNRGCEIIDVARACFYIIEQEYETGQALPVTGGQNMLK